MDESLNAWFAREVLVHGVALVRYLNRCGTAGTKFWGARRPGLIAPAQQLPATSLAFLPL
jgi:hypothetical protein